MATLSKVAVSCLITISLLASYCFADSPITSTDFYVAYTDIDIVNEAREKSILTEGMAGYLLSDSSIDKKVALINALSWNSIGKNNTRRFLNMIDGLWYKGLLSAGSTNWYDVLQEISDELPADILLCLGYLMLMDDYFHPEPAIPILEKAVEKNNEESFTFLMILALANAQHLQKEDEKVDMYLVVKNVIDNKSLEVDMRQKAINIIMQYINLYKDTNGEINRVKSTN